MHEGEKACEAVCIAPADLVESPPHALYVCKSCTLLKTLNTCNNDRNVISSYFVLEPQPVSFYNYSYGRLLRIIILADLQSAY